MTRSADDAAATSAPVATDAADASPPWYERLSDPEFELHGTRFRVELLDYHSQRRALEVIRVAMGRLNLGGGTSPEELREPDAMADALGATVFQVVGLLTSDELQSLESELYKGVHALMAGHDMELALSKSAHVVFASRALDSYTVTVRAFCVNFLDSLKESASPLLDALQSLPSLQRPT